MRAQKGATANQGGTRMAEDKEDQRVSYDEAFFFKLPMQWRNSLL